MVYLSVKGKNPMALGPYGGREKPYIPMSIKWKGKTLWPFGHRVHLLVKGKNPMALGP